jgi:hypothetical protein
MSDPISLALELLDAEAPKKGVTHLGDIIDPRSRRYNVPTMRDRRQVVQAAVVQDSLFGERLDLYSVAVSELPVDAGLLLGLLAAAKDFRRARICVPQMQRPSLMVIASFVPNELHEGIGPRLLHALREVAAIADSLEGQITGADTE